MSNLIRKFKDRKTPLTWEQFQEYFKPITNEANGEGCLMFETYGKEYEKVLAWDRDKVWTVLDCDGTLVLGSGWHYVNRFGYLLCEVPLPEGVYFMEAEY